MIVSDRGLLRGESKATRDATPHGSLSNHSFCEMSAKEETKAEGNESVGAPFFSFYGDR